MLFSFLGRDFFNALSEKDVDRFYQMLAKWLGALFLGIPVFVLRDYVQSTLALDWRNWMTRKLTADYFANRAFYQVQAGALVDNPDQRIASDVRCMPLMCDIWAPQELERQVSLHVVLIFIAYHVSSIGAVAVVPGLHRQQHTHDGLWRTRLSE